uniref:Caspase-8-like n=1 Tax=Neolamprologus brichardi TaxID=32507 RepID=A0A3Q4HIH9_NEOBR
MDRLTLSHIDEGLGSSEVAELCFLCRDVVTRRRLENVSTDAKDLFLRLEEKGLLRNDAFLRQLLDTIHRADLLRVLETDSRPPEETDASPVLSDYRKTLYSIYNDFTTENFEKLKFLLTNKLGRRQMELSKTALDVFAEMEKSALLSETDVSLLHEALQECDQQLAITLEEYTQGIGSTSIYPHMYIYIHVEIECVVTPSNDYQRESINTDAQLETNSTSLPDQVIHSQSEYYTLTHNPRGWCVVFNNEIFTGTHLKDRKGTQKDADTLKEVFTHFGFKVKMHDNCTAEQMKKKINDLGRINFTNHDALVVCVLSHGEKGCVFGADGERVFLKELTDPFTSGRASTLAGKPKLFFIQACQGEEYQKGYYPSSREDENQNKGVLQSDASIPDEAVLVPELADFLIGMATVEEFKSFRNTVTGSIYIQELCKHQRLSGLAVRDVGVGVCERDSSGPHPASTVPGKNNFSQLPTSASASLNNNIENIKQPHTKTWSTALKTV